MSTRRYYSARTGKNRNAVNYGLDMLQRLFLNTYKAYEERCYFQEAFGYYCVDEGRVAGSIGADVEAAIVLRLRKSLKIEPMEDHYQEYSEEDIFDLIEFLYDSVAQPIEGRYHNFANCGWHYYKFDKDAGQSEFRDAVNVFLSDYQGGFELSNHGEILTRADDGLQPLLDAEAPNYEPDKVSDRIRAAVLKFRRYHSSTEDRRDAVRDLADVLEYLRPKAAKYLLTKKDENDLFQIANGFGIRHHNPEQKTDYDKGIWYSWLFYYYLATIHAAVRVIQKNESSPSIS